MKTKTLPEDIPCPDDMFKNTMCIPDENFERLADAIISLAVKDARSKNEKLKFGNPLKFIQGGNGLVSELWFSLAKRKYMKSGVILKSLME